MFPTEILELQNLADEPGVNFKINPEDLNDSRILATIHNHPDNNLNLSVNDYYTFKNYSSMLHFIINKNGDYKAYIVKEDYVHNASKDEISRVLEKYNSRNDG